MPLSNPAVCTWLSGVKMVPGEFVPTIVKLCYLVGKNSRFHFCVMLLTSLFLPVYSVAASQSDRVDIFLAEDFAGLLEKHSTLTVAVLPMENFSVDPRVTLYLRQRIIQRLQAKGYSVLKQQSVDKELNSLGISHAGQLNEITFEELQANMSAEWFLSGVVEQAAIQNAGVYNAYVYTCSLKLQDTTGKVLWSALQGRVAKRRFALDPVNAFLDVFLIKEGGSADEAMKALADMLLSSLPDGPATMIAGDPLLEQAIEIQAVSK